MQHKVRKEERKFKGEREEVAPAAHIDTKIMGTDQLSDFFLKGRHIKNVYKNTLPSNKC